MMNCKFLTVVFFLIVSMTFSSKSQAIPVTAKLFESQAFGGSFIGNIVWEVSNGTAALDINLLNPNDRIVSFSFNTNPVNFPCLSCPVPPPSNSGVTIDDSSIVVSVPNLPSATVKFDGTNNYDWSIFDFEVSNLSVIITGLPLSATNADIAVPNNLVETVTGLSGEFQISRKITNRSFRQASTNIANIPEPTTLAIFAFGLAGFALTRRKRCFA